MSGGHDHGHDHAEFDKDVNLKPILAFGAALAVSTLLSYVAVELMMKYLKSDAAAKDPKSESRLLNANVSRVPPEPHLQEAPQRDMREMLAQQNGVLTSYGWVDKPAGVARIPIERAISILSRGEGAKPSAAPGNAAPLVAAAVNESPGAEKPAHAPGEGK